MSISSFESGHYSGPASRHSSGISGFIAFISAKWSEYRLMRSIESVPYDVMKDVGFPAAERANEM
jgi:hypothetical protein